MTRVEVSYQEEVERLRCPVCRSARYSLDGPCDCTDRILRRQERRRRLLLKKRLLKWLPRRILRCRGGGHVRHERRSQ